MLGARSKSGLADAKGDGKPEGKVGGKPSGKPEAKSNGKGTPPTPRGETPPTPKGDRPRKPAVPKANAAHGTPPSAPRTADKSPRSADRKSPKGATRITTTTPPPPEKQGKAGKPSPEPQAAKPSQELQAQLDAVQEALKKAMGQLVEKEEEKGKVLEELECAKKVADEANAKLKEALDVQSRAVEIEKVRSMEPEQQLSNDDSTHREEDELRRKLKSMQSQQEADASALHSTVEQLEKARYELADAIDAKNWALSQADDAMRACEVNTQKIELLNAEVERLKGLLDSEVESKSREAADKIGKLEAENSVLKLELEKAKVAEKKVIELEGVVEQLRADVANAKKECSKSEELADQLKKKVQLLEFQLDEADESLILKGKSLDSVMEELDETSTLLKDKESEAAMLHDNVRSLEDEVTRLKEEIDVTNERLDAAEKDTADLIAEVEELRLKLQTVEEEKTEALNNDQLASSEIAALTEQKNELAKELEASKDEVEKVKKAMEGLASALHEMSAESREAQEKYLIKQEEIERARAQIEELNNSLQNAKESYEVMLDEVNYEKVCLKKSVERMEAEAKNVSEEWQSKELSFVNSIRKSEEEIVAVKAQMDKYLAVVNEKEAENTELLEKMNHLEAQLVEANKASEEAKAETRQLKDKLLDKENELQNIQEENEDLQAKESAASEKIKKLSSLMPNGTTNGGNKEEDNENGGGVDDEPVVVVAKMWENSKVTDYDSSKEKENDGESEADLESNKGDSALDSNGLQSAKANNSIASPTKQQQQKKKKFKFSGLLKKKSSN
ncbi:WEB family protein At5g16730, chloroplastic [Hordeum vulgare subsp. vulgare]|uniref:WEB family protein At5g16730, chloroplastic n=1 Tax=Hordeum vulgare subsp. vulgare TaxID=112509 RepID=UPI000295329B|nr:WEB family protein At5g16730, chloroplastic [Hordeum vulgare subsp. vulgare]